MHGRARDREVRRVALSREVDREVTRLHRHGFCRIQIRVKSDVVTLKPVICGCQVVRVGNEVLTLVPLKQQLNIDIACVSLKLSV